MNELLTVGCVVYKGPVVPCFFCFILGVVSNVFFLLLCILVFPFSILLGELSLGCNVLFILG